MILKTVTFGSLLLSGVLVTAGTTTSDALPILTPAASCGALTGAQSVDIQRFSNATTNSNAAARTVVCTIPRNIGTPAQFLVSGNNAAGSLTTCTLSMVNAAGGVVASVSFNSIVGGWTATINFASPPVVGNEHATLTCNLSGSNTGALIGFQANP